jgi:peptidoglycan hydrolase-like protein with peptidoglycan-binding domain
MIFIMAFIFYGCNIVPKTVQYQKEEEKILGSVDIINPVVEEIQVVLSDLGYDVGNQDGKMGHKTREAIKEFQESVGLRSTGYVSKKTFRQIEDVRREKENSELKELYTIKVRKPSLEGKKEFSVTTKNIQTALKNAGFDPGPIDGKMGARTKQAVLEFQKTKGLVVDGKVGPKTWTELGRYLE